MSKIKNIRCPILKDGGHVNDNSKTVTIRMTSNSVKRFSTLNLEIPPNVESFKINFKFEEALTQRVRNFCYWYQQDEKGEKVDLKCEMISFFSLFK